MIAIVLVGVMLDRPILTMRTLTLAALLVLLLAPEAVVHPSFQMSFAATLALIATYARGASFARAGADSSLGARAALWGVREVVGLIVASLVAGLATMPYAAYHFHRLAPYGVLANLLVMPIVSWASSASSPLRSASTRNSGGKWDGASSGWIAWRCGSLACLGHSGGSRASAPGRSSSALWRSSSSGY
jgi:ComEC/Rec2-related protein